MAIITSGSTILVTGANGFIASWIIRDLLEGGYTVRGTVRTKDKIPHLTRLFKTGVDSGKFHIVVVEDITKPGSMDDALQGVDAVIHTACPFHFGGGGITDFSDPAVKGTTEVLNSALRQSDSQLKRVVVLSSIAAVCPVIPTHAETFNEDNWNEADIKHVQEHGEGTTPFAKYCSAKALAEKAGWEFVSKHKGEIKWDLVTLCPTMVFGPVIHDVQDPSALNTSVKEFYDTVIANNKPVEWLAIFQSAWVDVRDVALAHIRALQLDSAGGKRFIISAGNFVWQDFFDAVNSLGIPGVSAPTGTPGAGQSVQYYFKYDTTKAHTVLGIETRDLVTTAKDMIEEFHQRGWISK